MNKNEIKNERRRAISIKFNLKWVKFAFFLMEKLAILFDGEIIFFPFDKQ